jgi:hypothetical protein
MSAEAFDPVVVFKALLERDFEVRLTESGALMIFDLRYEKGRRLRAPNPLLAKFVFDHADRMGRWLEERERAA